MYITFIDLKGIQQQEALITDWSDPLEHLKAKLMRMLQESRS